ncbi:MAG: selenoneine biosynthesis selenosugar synthase SenB [Acidobacteriota bacterium]
MRIVIVTPAPPGSRHGNRTTARRWANLLRDLGHQVTIQQAWNGRRCDLLVALHARRSLPSIKSFHHSYPQHPLIIALTGTDLYRDLARHQGARRSLTWTHRLIVLNRLAPDVLPPSVRSRVVVITQSAWGGAAAPSVRHFDICVLAHLRPVKDPFRTAMAVRLLPRNSRVRVLQMGRALTPQMKRRVLAEKRRNARYLWYGDLPRWRALAVLARCRLLVISSRAEGGANAVSEALARDVPILASRIPGNLGLLGNRYPGTFPVGDTRHLARLIHCAETDPVFLNRLKAGCRRAKQLIDPDRERAAWQRLLQQIRP